MPPRRVLLLASAPTTQRHVQLLLDGHGWLAVAAASVDEARRQLRAEYFACVIVDGAGPARRELVAELAAQGRGRRDDAPRPSPLDAMASAAAVPPVVVIVSGNDRALVAELLAMGVADVVESHLLDPLLAHRLDVVARSSRSDEGRAARGAGVAGGSLRRAGRRRSDLLIGRSPQMLALAEQIDMIAKADIGVAIFGETGTGKDLVARTIHASSRRAGKPYVVANCTALPEQLFENELFGHERGAFTGADSRQEGLIAEAEGGSLVLDEIGDLKGGVQAKLLRLLQSREYKMIGGSKTLRADVRILATTHRDLRQAVGERRFREDLYYRLNTLQITLPPLRDRLEDVALLVDHFVALFNEREGRDFHGFTPDAIARLQGHRWPGNVRELESVVYRSLVMAGTRQRLGAEEVQLGRDQPDATLDPSRPFAELKAEAINRFERSYLEALLRRAGGNLAEAARLARHERKSLWRLLRKHELDPRDFRPRTR